MEVPQSLQDSGHGNDESPSTSSKGTGDSSVPGKAVCWEEVLALTLGGQNFILPQHLIVSVLDGLPLQPGLTYVSSLAWKSPAHS
jgi:hypothetical protein